MAESGINGIGVDLLKTDFEVSTNSFQNGSWSLGCDITVEDADAEFKEIRVNDITLLGSFSTEELTVEVNHITSNPELDVDFGVGAIGGIEGELGDINETISGIQEGMAEINKSIAGINEESINIKTTINGIQSKVNDIGTEMTTKASVESVVEIGDMVTEVQKNQVEQSIRVDSLTAEVSTKASAESVTEIADELTITNESLAEQTMRVTDLDAKIKTKASASMVTELGEDLKLTNESLAEQIIRADNLSAEVGTKASMESVSKLTDDLNATNSTVAEHTIKVTALESEVSTKASAESVTELGNSLKTTAQSLAEQTLKVNALESEIKTKASTETVTQIGDSLNVVTENVAEQIIRTDELEASIKNLVTKETFNATTGEIEQRFTSVKQTTDSIETTIRSQEGEIASIKENVNGLSVGIGKVESDLDSLKNQIDGVTESFFYDYTPTLENEPAASWIENGTEAEHRGDTFTNTALTGEGAGKSWRWLQDENGNWGWTPIADTDAQKALLLASQAQATADGKCSTFHVQPSNYSIGDIWFVHNDDYAPYKKGEILTATKAGTIFSLSDWESLTRYSQAVDDLDAEMKGAFRDGVIDDAERKAIAEGLNALKSEKSGIDAGYNIVIINSDLAADAELKAEFKTAKNAYDDAYNALVAMVEEIINADLEELEGLFDEYNTLSDVYSQAVADYLDCKERVTGALMGRLNPASVYIDNITSDGKLTPIEKEQLFEIYRNIAREYDTNRGNAFNYKIWQYASDGVSEMQGNNGGNGRYETYTAYKESYAPIVSVFTSSVWGFEKMDETTTLPDGYSTTQLKQYLDAYYAARGELVEIFSAITAAIEDAQKAAEQTLSELTGILKPEEMTTLIGKGVVLSTIIATKDAEGNITAGMNASYEQAHPQYGRIVFAGGVADLSDWNSASFRVYESGHVVMQSGQVGESVQLGRAMLNSVLAGDIDLLSYPENGKLIPLFQVNKDDSGNIISISSVYDLYVNGNLVVKGDTSSGGTGQDTPAIGTVTGVEVNGIKYTDVSAGILDLSDAFNNVSVDLSDYYTKGEVDKKITDLNLGQYATASALTKGLATKQDIIADLATIRSNASNGATAYGWGNHASAGYAKDTDVYTKTEVDGKVTTINNSINAVSGRVTTIESWKTELSKYIKIENGNVKISTNLIVTGDSSSGGSGEDTPAIGTVTGIKVNGQTYNPAAGIVTIPDYPTTLEWDAIGGKPSFAAVATSGKYSDLSGLPTIPSLDGYATEKWVTDKGYATATALSSGLSGKVDKVSGKGLSTNDFTTTLLNKLNGIASGAQVNVQSDWNATSGDAFIKNKPTIPTVPTKVSAFTNDAGYLTSHQEVKNTGNTLSFGSAIIIGSVGGTNLTAALPSVASVKSTLGLGSLAYKSSLVASDIPDLSSKYLPLSGGTISGMLKLNTSDTDEVGIELSVNGISKGWLGYAEVDYGTCLYNYACDKYLGIKDDGTPHYNGYTLIHSGNYSSYALPLSGGTIQGHLTIGVDGSTTAQHLLRMYRMNGTTRNRLLAGILDDNSIELSYYSPTSGGYGRLVLGASTYKVGNSTLYDILHSGNVGSYAVLAGKWYNNGVEPARNSTGLLNGVGAYMNVGYNSDFWFRLYVDGSGLKFSSKRSDSELTGKTIAFTDSDITGNAATASLASKAVQLCTNPSGLTYAYASETGSFMTLGRNNYAAYLDGSSVTLRYGSSLAQGLILNSSGNVTIGNSDLARTDVKMAVYGTTRIHRSGSSREYLDISLADVSVYYNGYGPDGYSNHYFQSNGTTRLAILGNSGNVGIGTTSPAYKLDVNGDVRINGNLIVTGDSSSGGTGEGASMLHGPVSVNVAALLLLNGERNVTQATMDGYGLTQAVVANMLAGIYTKVTHTKDGGYKDVYSYDGYEDSAYITIFVRQGDSFDINTGMVLRYVRSSQTWQVSMNEI